MTRSMKQEKEQQKKYYDHSTLPLSELYTGENVRISTERGWEPAKVVQKTTSPQSYIVETPTGQTCRRNRRHLMKSLESNDTANQSTEQPTGQKMRIEQTNNTAPEEARKTSSGRIIRKPVRYREITS